MANVAKVSEWQGHSNASSLVRFWRAKQTENAFGMPNGETIVVLYWPGEGYTVQVSFAHVPGHPEWVRVRSTNWRCEHEPNGIYAIEDCRDFYVQLRNAGFVKRQLGE